MKCLWTVFRRFHHTEQQNHMGTSWFLCGSLFSHFRKIMLILMFPFVIKMSVRIAYWNGVPIVKTFIICDFRLPPRSIRQLSSYGLIRCAITQKSAVLTFITLPHCLSTDCVYVHMTLQCPEMYIFNVYMFYIYYMHYCNSCNIPGSVK
jgi:hypothetical protein